MTRLEIHYDAAGDGMLIVMIAIRMVVMNTVMVVVMAAMTLTMVVMTKYDDENEDNGG